MSKPMQIILGLVVLVLVAAGSFFGGMLVGKQQASAAAPVSFSADFQPPAGVIPLGDPSARPNAPGQQGAAGRFAAQPGMLVGQIESIEGNTLLIAGAEGQQTQVQVTDTTLIEKNASVTVADLETGETVMISGSENDDGSITARSLQVAPAGRMGRPPANAQSPQDGSQ
mgnify:CR=1 FL=1